MHIPVFLTLAWMLCHLATSLLAFLISRTPSNKIVDGARANYVEKRGRRNHEGLVWNTKPDKTIMADSILDLFLS